MGSFRTFVHQAQPKVAGGHFYMRVWLGHKEPELLHQHLIWRVYRQSVQAENILGVDWLLCSMRDFKCAVFQSAIEKRLGNKYEVRHSFKR